MNHPKTIRRKPKSELKTKEKTRRGPQSVEGLLLVRGQIGRIKTIAPRINGFAGGQLLKSPLFMRYFDILTRLLKTVGTDIGTDFLFYTQSKTQIFRISSCFQIGCCFRMNQRKTDLNSIIVNFKSRCKSYDHKFTERG